MPTPHEIGRHGTAPARLAALFVALFSTALALGGALAHLFELPNKVGLPREAYFIVQTIYDGWWQLAYVLAVQFVSMVAVLILYRSHRRVFWLAALALSFLLASQVVFWTYTHPANAATGNWTKIPENWEVLRNQWEYSHAVGAVLQMFTMAALLFAALASGGGGIDLRRE